MKKLATLLLTLMPLYAAAQDLAVTLPIPSGTNKGILSVAADGAKGKPALLQPIFFLKTLIDSSAVSSIDRNWIEQPKQQLAIEARTTFNQSKLRMETTWEEDNFTMVSKSNNGFSTSAGLWLGYRGYGLGFSKELGKTTGSTFSFGAMGGRFGLNLRISSYKSDMPDIYMNGEQVSGRNISDDRLEDPINVRNFFLDGYYMLNGKHFSYSAAYDNSLIQRRSAGSVVIGGMYFHSRVDYSADSNWLLTALMKDVGMVKFTQGSIGMGYAYNWVPARGLLVNAMAMPMFTFYNRTTKYLYDFAMIDPNGKIIDEEYLEGLDEGEYYDILFDPKTKISAINEREEKTGNKPKFNFDMRVCMTYNWDRWYVRAYGHFNLFRYGSDLVSGRMTDWTAYAALGFRFW
ncbi:MAG: DUF4421 family protein [Prevotella sp.]|nr:DUF4421 family protein [Prevotella sp.]